MLRNLSEAGEQTAKLNVGMCCGNTDIIYFVLKSAAEIILIILYIISNSLGSLLNIYGQFHIAV